MKEAFDKMLKRTQGSIKLDDVRIENADGGKETSERYRTELARMLHERASLMNAIKEQIVNKSIPITKSEFDDFSSKKSLRSTGVPEYLLPAAQTLLHAYRNERNELDNWLSEHNFDANKIFAAITGEPPTGKVTFSDHGLCIELLCFTLRDYNTLYASDGDKGEVATGDGTVGFTLPLFREENGVETEAIVINASVRGHRSESSQTIPALREHEIEHTWLTFLRLNLWDFSGIAEDKARAVADAHVTLEKSATILERLRLQPLKENDIRYNILRRSVRSLSQDYFDFRMADEILCHSHNDVYPWQKGESTETSRITSTNRYLGYMSEYMFEKEGRALTAVSDHAKEQKLGRAKVQWAKRAELEVIQTAPRRIEAALLAVSALRAAGIGNDEVVALLALEPLARWEKTARRILSVLQQKPSV